MDARLESLEVYSEWLVECRRDGGDFFDALNDNVLEVTVMREVTGSRDRAHVEFLLGCGGPTVWVTVDRFGAVSFHHTDHPEDTWVPGERDVLWSWAADQVKEVYV